MAGVMLPRYFHDRLPGLSVIAGEHPGAIGRIEETLSALREVYGVSHVLTLTEAPLELRQPIVTRSHVPIAGAPTIAQLARAAAIVAERRAAGDVILIHCQQGLDRTGCVGAAVLIEAGRSTAEAIAWAQDRQPLRRRHPVYLELWAPYVAAIRGYARWKAVQPTSR